MRSYLTSIKQSFTEVFGHTSYITLASALVLFAFTFAVWLPNIGFIMNIFTTSSMPFVEKMKITFSLLGGIGTNFTIISASYTILISILFGIVIAMLLYSYRKKQAQIGGNLLTIGFGGISSGVLGVGCAACGSFVLTSVLSFIGAGGALALLPLRGGEFGILSALLLLLLVFIISKKNFGPMVCEK